MPVSDAEFVTRIFLGAVFCAVVCCVVAGVAIAWAARVTIRCNRHEARLDDLEGRR